MFIVPQATQSTKARMDHEEYLVVFPSLGPLGQLIDAAEFQLHLLTSVGLCSENRELFQTTITLPHLLFATVQ
jgi:hypothetical protein